MSSAGHGPESEFSDPVETTLPPPGKPHASNVTHNSITLRWSKTDRGASIMQYYTIFYQRPADDRDRWTAFQTYNAQQNATLSDLEPKTAYVFKLRAECAAGASPDSELSDPIETLVPVSQPGKPFATKVTHDSVTLKWERPKQGAQYLKHYQVIYYSTDDSNNIAYRIAKEEKITLLKLDPESAHIFKVKAETVTGSISESELSDPIETLAEPWGVNIKIYRSLQPIPNSNPPTYLLPTHGVMQKDHIVKVHIGAISYGETKKGAHVHGSCSCHTRTQAGVPHKVLMVVGATGAGKTTLINGMANYILGVQWDDDFRFKLIAEPNSQDQTVSQTSCITAYTFYKEKGSPLPYTLTVIDTPGFGDTAGIDRDKKIVEQIKELFSISGDEGIDQLHGIGFVTQAPLARLTQAQRYVFDAILSVFGKDVADNIFLMITFADGMKPPVLDAVKAANVPNKAFFKFNNSAFFASKSHDNEFDKLFWKLGANSFNEFFKQIFSTQAQSLQLSREVIQERDTLEVTVQSLQSQIKAGLVNIDELRQTMDMAVLCKIKRACRCVQRLQEIALRPNYLTEVEFIDLIIETEKRDCKPRWMNRVKALEGVRQQAVIVTELMKNPQAQQQDIFSIEETAQEKSMWQKFLHKLDIKTE